MKEPILREDFVHIYAAGVRKGLFRALLLASEVVKDNPKLTIAILDLSKKQSDIEDAAITEILKLYDEMGAEEAGVTLR